MASVADREEVVPLIPRSSLPPLPPSSYEKTDKEVEEKTGTEGEEEEEDEEPTTFTYLFLSFFLTLPMVLLYGCLTSILHTQYQFESDLTTSFLLLKILKMFLPLFTFIYFTNRYKDFLLMEAFFFLLCLSCGFSLVWTGKKDQTFGAMSKTPGIATLWIYGVMQLSFGSHFFHPIFLSEYPSHYFFLYPSTIPIFTARMNKWTALLGLVMVLIYYYYDWDWIIKGGITDF